MLMSDAQGTCKRRDGFEEGDTNKLWLGSSYSQTPLFALTRFLSYGMPQRNNYIKQKASLSLLGKFPDKIDLSSKDAAPSAAAKRMPGTAFIEPAIADDGVDDGERTRAGADVVVAFRISRSWSIGMRL